MKKKCFSQLFFFEIVDFSGFLIHFVGCFWQQQSLKLVCPYPEVGVRVREPHPHFNFETLRHPHPHPHLKSRNLPAPAPAPAPIN